MNGTRFEDKFISIEHGIFCIDVYLFLHTNVINKQLNKVLSLSKNELRTSISGECF